MPRSTAQALNVLLLERDAIDLATQWHWLVGAGHRVVTAATFRECYLLDESGQRFDVVICDGRHDAAFPFAIPNLLASLFDASRVIATYRRCTDTVYRCDCEMIPKERDAMIAALANG